MKTAPRPLLTALLALALFSTSSQALDRGKVGQPPQRPEGYPLIEENELLLTGDPTVVMLGPWHARVSFETVLPTPPARLYFGPYEKGSRFRVARYRMQARETGEQPRKRHKIELNLRKLRGDKIDTRGFEERGGGLIACRLEVFHPGWARARLIDFRFAFHEDELVPAVVEGPFLDLVGPHSATISFRSDRESMATLHVNDKTYTIDNTAISKSFVFKIDSLSPGQEQEYRIELTDGHHTRFTEPVRFRTPAIGQSNFRFAILGDSREGVGGGERVYGGVNRRSLERFLIDATHRGAAFVINSGDLVNGYTSSVTDFDRQLAAFKDVEETVAHFLPIYEAFGNHEIVMDIYDHPEIRKLRFDKRGEQSSERRFARAFVNPENGPTPALPEQPPYDETAFWFDHGNSRFVVMNNNYWYSKHAERFGGNLEGYVLDDQYAWLLETFAAAKADSSVEHLFLIAQEAMFPNGGHTGDSMWYGGGDPAVNNGIPRYYVVERRNEIWAAFVNTGKAVSANFGDEHNYSRTWIPAGFDERFEQGCWQIVSGGAGAPFYDFVGGQPWSEQVVAFDSRMNYTLYQVQGERVKLQAWSFEGELIDEVELLGAAAKAR